MTLVIIYRDGLWHVVRSSSRTISLFSSESSTAAVEWRDAYQARRRAA